MSKEILDIRDNYVTKCCGCNMWDFQAGNRENVICRKCNKWTKLKRIPYWKKEFEALWQVEMKWVSKPNGFNVKCELVSSKTKETIGSLIYKYIKQGKVKIKCKKDCIQIERVK